MTYYTNLAAVYFEMGEYDKAIEECDKVVEKSKVGVYDYVKVSKAKARKANCLYKKDLIEESIQCYKESLMEHNDYNVKQALKKV